MKNTRTVIVSIFVLIVLFFVFRSAEASPGEAPSWLPRQDRSGKIAQDVLDDQIGESDSSAVSPIRLGKQLNLPSEPSRKLPLVREAPDLDADLSVAILDRPDPVLVSRNLTYTVTVTNNAITVTVTNVVLTDTLPGTVSLVSATPLQGVSCTGTSLVVCNLGSIPAGNSSKVVIVVTPNSTGTISNSALVKAADPDSNQANNSTSENTTVNPLADLSLTLSVSNLAPYMGSTIAYTVTVTNGGPSQATGVTVRDALPAGYTYVGDVPTQGSYNSSTGDWTGITLNNGASAKLRLNATVNASGSYSNYAQVLLSGVADPDSTPGNSSTTEDDDDSLTTNPLPAADLSISKSGASSVTAGTSLVYSLAINNAGPSIATTVLVTDTLPLGMTYVTASGTDWLCSALGRTISCTRASLGVGAAPGINITASANPDARGKLTNRSRISSGVGELNTANNTSNLDTTVTGVADLALVMTVSNATPYVGSSIAFTVTLTNSGPSQATGVLVKDLLLSGYTFTGYGSNQGTYDSGTGIWTVGALNPDASVFLRLNGTVKAGGDYNNYAQVWFGNETDPDSTPGDNSTTQDDDDTRSTTPIPVANLSLTKSDTPATVAAGSILTYTLTVLNIGPSDASTLVLTDTLPAGVTYQPPAIGAWACSPVGAKVRCTLSSLVATQNSSVKIRVLVSSGMAAGTINNTATVRSAAFDSNLTNNSATEPTVVINSANLSITKVDKPDPVVAGTNLVYTLTVSNAGPSDAAGLAISDTLPGALTNIVVTPGSWACGVVGQRVSCTLGALAVGGANRVVVTAKVGANTPSGTQLSNAAVVSASTPDPASANNRATQGTGVTTSADLSITKVDKPDPVIAGSNLVYTLTVSNAGPSDAAGLAISDTLPGALTNIVVTPGSWACGVVGQRVSCTLGTLAVGGTNRVVVTAKVAVSTPSGTQLSNAAVVSASTPDPASANNRATQGTGVTTSADLSITKVDKPDNGVIAGTNLVYTLTVSNAGPSDAAGLAISDTLPVALTNIVVTSGSWACGLTGQRVNCTLVGLAVGGTSRVVVTAKVAVGTPSGTQLSNAAVVSASTPDPANTNNRATQGTGVTTSADLSITKVDKPDNGVIAGSNLVYTLTVSNAGPSDAAGVTISDTLPGFLTNLSVTPGTPTCTLTGQLLSCNLGTLAVGATSRAVVTAKVNASTLPGTISNTAAVNSSTSDPTPSNNRATQTTTVTTLADPSITKVDKPDSGVVAGTNLVYTLTVSNTGPSNVANVVLSDTLPAAVTYQTIAQGPFSCGYDSGLQRVTCNLTTLAPSGTARAVVTVKVNSSTPIGTITNAVVVSSGTPDSNSSNNRATQSTTVNTQANLSIAKLDGPDPVIAGTNLVYTLTETNAGPSDALNVVVTDTLPTGLTFQSFSGDGWTCTNPVGLKVRCTRPSLAASTNSLVYLITRVGSGVTAALFNSAVVVSDTIDPNPGNNSANATTTVNARADVGVTTIHKPEPVIAGTNIVYTVTVTNSGPSDAQNVVLTENLPNGTNYVSINSGGASCNRVLQTITCSFTPIIAGTNRQIVVTALVASGTTGVINNVASLNGTGGAAPNNRTSDLNPANDSYTDPANVIARSDFGLIITDKPDPVTAGTSLVYTLTVTNNGPSNSVNAVVTDTLPPGVTYQSSTGVAWTCSLLSGARVRCSRGGMIADTSSTVALNLLVNSGTTGTLSNSAVVGSSTVDPVTTNNTGLQTTTVNTLADLSVLKLDKPDPVTAGTNLTYTVTVSNLGPSDAVGVVFTDTLPSGVTYQSTTSSGWTCTLNGVRLRCGRTAILVANTNDRVVITTRVNSSTTAGSLSNSVLVRSNTTDLVSGNNSATAATTVITSADLRISKVDTIDPVVAGSGMAYTIVITNTGPSDAVGVKITDTLPAGVSYVTHVPTPEWVCQVVASELHCSRSATMVVNARLQLDVAVLVDAGVTGTLSNLVRVGATTADQVTANNTDTELTVVSPQSNLSITKVESIDPVIAGTNLTYTLTVSNAGPSHAASLVVTDTLPANVTYQSFGGSSGWSCTLLTANRLRCTRSSLDKNASSVVSIATKVKSSATGSLSNNAIVRSSWPDPSLPNNSVTIGTTVNTRADMSVDKTDSPDPVAEGQTLTYKVVVKNNGPSDAASVSLNESIPSEVTFVSALPVPQGTCSGSGPVICNLGSVVSGNSITITVTTTAKLVANVPKNISNTATVSTTTTDPTPANDTKTISTQVLPAADLRLNLESLVTQVQTGNPLTYTLWITNTGPSIANNVVVTDTLPAELTYKSSSRTPAVTSPKVVWNLGNIGVGQSVSFRLVVNVKSPTKTLVNQAVTKSNIWDIVPANSQDQVSVQAIDNVAPTVTWKLPVANGGNYTVGNEVVRLEVLATDNVAVAYVRFYRWDEPNGIFVDIGYDYLAATCQFNPALICYQWDLTTTILNPKWNEIRARAYDETGNPSPSPSLYSFIFLYRNVTEVYLPFVKK